MHTNCVGTNHEILNSLSVCIASFRVSEDNTISPSMHGLMSLNLPVRPRTSYLISKASIEARGGGLLFDAVANLPATAL